MKNVIKSIVKRLGYQVISTGLSNELTNKIKIQESEIKRSKESLNKITQILPSIGNKNDNELHGFLEFITKQYSLSNSQLFQDLFVLYLTSEKRNGYFVEFGGADGINLSNTYLLEKAFGWEGIVAEPGQIWKEALMRNRTCKIDNRCVWKQTGETISFKQTGIAELSTLSSFAENDNHKKLRQDFISYDVKTVSLIDLLDQAGAPPIIDYLSIDTEGSEFEILEGFNFQKYSFRVITVEHNYTPLREQIYRLLVSNGYERKFEELSLFDDWYTKKTI